MSGEAPQPEGKGEADLGHRQRQESTNDEASCTNDGGGTIDRKAIDGKFGEIVS